MYDAINPIFQWLNAHPHFSGLVTFIISAAESVAIIGTVVPGSLMMTAIGALAGAGVIPLWPTIIWAILGAIVGDGISYRIGYIFKDRLHNIWPFRAYPSLLESGERFFYRHGGTSVFIGRFVGPVRALVPLVAGMLGMSPLRFYIANILSAIGWAPAYMFPGILLGALSLELPPDIAVHFILMLVLLCLFIALCLWLIRTLFIVISGQVDQFLSWIWKNLQNSRYFHVLTTALKHHDKTKTYGQLTLAFYFIVTCILFLYLALFIITTHSADLRINNAFFHLFRSLRTPTGDTVMLYISFLGDKTIVFPVLIALFGWLAWKNRWHTALHVLALGIITIGSVFIFKHIVHSPRPWGIATVSHGEIFSFPSGHATIATAVYIGIALLLMRAFKLQPRWPVYTLVGIMIIAISISRLSRGGR